MKRKRKGLGRLIVAGSLLANAAILILIFLYFQPLKQLAGQLKHEAVVAVPERAQLAKDLITFMDNLSASSPQSFEDSVDFVRHWMHTHSVHLIDSVHNTYAYDTPLAIHLLADHARQPEGELPHLSCEPYSLIMQRLLDTLEIPNRIVHTYADHYDTLRGHTFVEVLDRSNERWHIQDADFGIYYEDTLGQRADLRRLVLEELSQFTPVHGDGRRGWEEIGIGHLENWFFEAGRWEQHYALINTDRLDLERRFQGNGNATLKELFWKSYGHRRIVIEERSSPKALPLTPDEPADR